MDENNKSVDLSKSDADEKIEDNSKENDVNHTETNSFSEEMQIPHIEESTGTFENQGSLAPVKKPKKDKKKLIIWIPTALAVVFFLMFVTAPSSSELEDAKDELAKVQAEYDKYKEEMEPYSEFTAADLAAAKEVKEKEAAAEKKRLDAEKAKGYETGITYNQLARNPDKYEGKKVKFSGKVIQVMEGDDTVQIRLVVNDNYDTVLYCEYDKGIVSSRILEDDYITVYGISAGTITYQSTMGGNITIPGVSVDKIKR